MSRLTTIVACICLLSPLVSPLASAQGPGGGGPGGPPPPPPLPPVQIPPQNPLTAQKALLGKFLFWEEQLSSDDSVACGTCHMPEMGGSDFRSSSPESVHPGFDGNFGTADDVAGSLGMMNQDCNGVLIESAPFGPTRQVTGRKSPTMIGAAYSPTQFWDGRATGQFVDPETGVVVIPVGGGLESQSVGPILSSAEMACDSRTWADVIAKLQAVTPLALATDLPADMASALVQFPNYPALFQNAFGTPAITARRIGFALASYERTLIPDQAPYDAFAAGQQNALSLQQRQGFQVFVQNCLPCHGGGEQSDHQFHNIGVRPIFEDLGRGAVTGNPAHNGRFKTPTLRNVKMRAPYFHNGGKATLAEVLTFYNVGGEFFVNQAPQIQPLGLNQTQLNNLQDFLENGLTDPRVEQGLPPFDHPRLQPYFTRGDANQDGGVDLADVIATLSYLFAGGQVACLDAVDSNDDGTLDISDPVRSLTRLFLSTDPLPMPTDLTVGPDPTQDLLDCDT
ncbi:MAG: cytochrome c peroxidase [Planctomycetota bacterium]